MFEGNPKPHCPERIEDKVKDASVQQGRGEQSPRLGPEHVTRYAVYGQETDRTVCICKLPQRHKATDRQDGSGW